MIQWLCWHLLLHTSATGHPKKGFSPIASKSNLHHTKYTVTNCNTDLLGNKVHKIYFWSVCRYTPVSLALFPIYNRLPCISLLFPLLTEGERGGEYSEAWFAFLWAVIQKLMSKAISTLCARYFQGRGGLIILGHTVRLYSFCEGWPWGGMVELLCAEKEFIPTLGTYIDACKKDI